MRSLSVFEQRPIFRQLNDIFKVIRENQSDRYLKGVYLERALHEETDDFSGQLDRLYAHEKVDRKLIEALAEINKLYSTLGRRVFPHILAYIQNIVEIEIKSLKKINANKFDEAKAKSSLLDLEVKTDSSWRNPSPDIQARTHTPFSSGEDDEYGKNLTK